MTTALTSALLVALLGSPDARALLIAWDQDLAAGLSAEQVVAALAEQAPGAAAGDPLDPIAIETAAIRVWIGHRTADPALAFGALSTLAVAHGTPRPEADVPALAATCRAMQLAALDGRPLDHPDACAPLLDVFARGLGDGHPRAVAERVRLAGLHWSRAERVAALTHIEAALAHWAPPAWPEAVREAGPAWVRALWRRGTLLRALGRPSDALAALDRAREVGDAVGHARAADWLRLRTQVMGALAEAREWGRLENALVELASEFRRQGARLRRVPKEETLRLRYWDQTAAVRGIAGAGIQIFRAFWHIPDPDSAKTLELVDQWNLTVPGEWSDGDPLLSESTTWRARLLTRAYGGDADPRSTARDRKRDLEREQLHTAAHAVHLLDRIPANDDYRRPTEPDPEARSEQLREAAAMAYLALAVQAHRGGSNWSWLTLSTLAESSQARGWPGVAIAWAKAAVDAAERVRQDAAELGVEADDMFLRARAPLYEALAGLLVEHDRLYEADAALRALSRIGVAGLTRATAPTGDPTSYSEPEQAWRDARREAVEALRVRRKPQSALSFAEALIDADVALAAHDPSPAEVPEDDLVDRMKELSTEELGAALLQVIPTPDVTWLVLTTPTGRRVIPSPIGRAALNRRAFDFYRALRARDPAADDLAAALYADLLALVDPHLDGIGTLMVAPGGALRYVPFAALRTPKGEYAIQKRAIVRAVPRLSADVFDRPPLPDARRILAFGAASPGGGLSPLPSVPFELDGIVRDGPYDPIGALPGRVSLDGAFTPADLRAALAEAAGPPGGAPTHATLVHIASHFVFHPGSPAESFLALGGGQRLDMRRLAGPDYPFEGVELLTLSACETAVGTFAPGQPIDSFAALAMEKGARAVLASLWPVSDDSTAALMRAFYANLALPDVSMAEALRRAQLAVLGRPGVGGPDRKIGLPDAAPARDPHPYTWAPFVLTGDWR